MGTWNLPQTGQRISDVLTGNNLSATEVALLQAYVDYGLTQNWSPISILRDVLALAISFPSYMYY